MSDRTRGVIVYPMPESVCGPYGNRYALLLRGSEGHLEARMVHTEGVSYIVTPDKPWRWDDYTPSEPYSIEDLIGYVDPASAVDLADWVHVFGARLESNFGQVHWWATQPTIPTQDRSTT